MIQMIIFTMSSAWYECAFCNSPVHIKNLILIRDKPWHKACFEKVKDKRKKVEKKVQPDLFSEITV